MKKSRSLKNDRFSFRDVFTYSKVLSLFDNMSMNFHPIYSSIFAFFHHGGRHYLFVALFSAFRTTDFGVVFWKKILLYACKQCFAKHKIPCWLDFFIFETTTNHFVAQSSLENGACNDASRFVFPCCPLETFYPRGQVKLGYGLQTFITKSPSFSAIGIRTIPTVVCNVCFLFLLSFFGKLRDWLNKQVTVISSQSARRRRLVDQ